MLFHHGERLVRSAYAVIDGASSGSGGREPGVLYLTNYRITFESRGSRGLVRGFVRGHESEVVVDSSLHDVRDVTIRRGRVGRPRLIVVLPQSRLSFDVLDPDAWMGAIAQAKRALPPSGAPGAMPSMVIERQVVKVRCRYCGSLGNEVDGRCPSCGAAL